MSDRPKDEARRFAPGDLVTGDLVTGDLVTGDLVTGDLVTGDLVTGDLVTLAARVRDGVADPDILGRVTGLTGAGRVAVRWWETEQYGGWGGDYPSGELCRVRVVPAGDKNPQAAGDASAGISPDAHRPAKDFLGEGAGDE